LRFSIRFSTSAGRNSIPLYRDGKKRYADGMTNRTLHLMAIMAPHRLAIDIYRLRDILWRTTGDVSTKILPPCIPLLAMAGEDPIPDGLAWEGGVAKPSGVAVIQGGATVLPVLPDKRIQSLKIDLQARLCRSYDDAGGNLFGIPSPDSAVGIFLGGASEALVDAVRLAQPFVLSSLDDMRLAIIACTLRRPDSLSAGASWHIVDQRHLVPSRQI
jgi:hypothetical protein